MFNVMIVFWGFFWLDCCCCKNLKKFSVLFKLMLLFFSFSVDLNFQESHGKRKYLKVNKPSPFLQTFLLWVSSIFTCNSWCLNSDDKNPRTSKNLRIVYMFLCVVSCITTLALYIFKIMLADSKSRLANKLTCEIPNIRLGFKD